MGTFRITVEIADPQGQHFEAVDMLVDTGATFTKASRDLLERLSVPVESTYTAELADGSRVQRTRGRTMIRLQGKEFPTPVTFGEDGEQNLLGAIALDDAMLAVDPHSRRLIPVDVVVQRFRQVKWKGNLSVLPFRGQLGQTPYATVVGSIGGLSEGTGVLPYRVARDAQLSSDLT